MLRSSQRPTLHSHQRDTLAWLILLSLALHVTLIAPLLLLRPAQRLTDQAEPLSVEIIAGGEPAQVPKDPAASAEVAAAPIALAAPVEQAEITPPMPARVPSAQLSPPVYLAEPPAPAMAPSPTPAATSIPVPPAPAPDVPPPLPVQEAQLPPPTPPRPPAAQVLQARPAPQRPSITRPVQRAAAAPSVGSSSANPTGTVATATSNAMDAQNAASRASAASNGPLWMGRLKQWWDQHSFYPKEASQTNEGGNVRVRIAIAPDGQVTSIQVVQGSGSSVLDGAALAVFRNARLPPLTPGTLAQPADVVVTLHYRPADGG